MQSSGLFTKIYVPPSPGDGGLALGAAQLAYTKNQSKTRPLPLKHPFLGSHYSRDSVINALESASCSKYRAGVSFAEIAELLDSGMVIGFFSGKSEIGPRALGARSIIASPRDPMMKDLVNKKIKFREEYRPFAPSVHRSHVHKYFYVGACNYNYMSTTVIAKQITEKAAPSIVHVDGTPRIHVPDPESDLEALLDALIDRNHPPILLNTSFNLKGEPNVESPTDAIRTFYSSGLDALYINGFLLLK